MTGAGLSQSPPGGAGAVPVNLRKAGHALRRGQKNLRREVGRAIADFHMIKDGDLVLVAMSGGKDSHVLLDILLNLQRHAPVKFHLHAVNLDQKQPGFPADVLPAYLGERGVPFTVLEKDTYSIVTEKIPEGKTYCGLCSRLRRGILYNFAEQLGAASIALGHHRDDIVETLFLNMFHGGRLKAMPPKLLSDDRRNMVIRPLAYCREKEIADYARRKAFPIIPCNLCGSQRNLQRQAVKAMLANWEGQHPGRVESIFRSICRVSPSQLADTDLFPFRELQVARTGEPEACNADA